MENPPSSIFLHGEGGAGTSNFRKGFAIESRQGASIPLPQQHIIFKGLIAYDWRRSGGTLKKKFP